MKQAWKRVFGYGLLLLVSQQALAADVPSTERWVQGSWINVRQDVAADSTVTAHLVANTRVSLLTVSGKTCQVVWGKEPHQQGYVACRFLGESPLDFEKISQRWGSNGESASYAPDKAFWMRPSLARLLEAGESFEGRFMPAAEAKIKESGGFEGETPKLVRYPIPEFEAMKALMQQGIVPAEEVRPLMTPLSVVFKKLEQSAEYEDSLQVQGIYIHKMVLGQLKAIRLPVAQPSLFRKPTDFAPPSASVENMAAQFGIAEQAAFKGGMHWICSRVQDGCFFTGVWDIGAYSLQLQRPVYLQAIDRRGLVSAMEYPGVLQYGYTAEDYEETCRSELLAAGLPDLYKRGHREGRLLPGYPRLKSPLFWFFTPSPLSAKAVKLRSYRIKANASRLTSAPDIGIYEVDLDSDKVPDFVLVSGALGGEIVMDGWFHLLLANVAGEWVLASSSEDTDCT